MLRNVKSLPLDITDKDWLIQTNVSYEDNQNLKHVGRWSVSVAKTEQNETWSKLRKLYKTGALPGCKYIMSSTAASPQKFGVILAFFDKSMDETYIKKCGQMLLDKLNYKPPLGVTGIYYKSKTVRPEKKWLYRLDLPAGDSDSD